MSRDQLGGSEAARSLRRESRNCELAGDHHMRIVVSTVGRFHIFALARELERQGLLTKLYTGFPWFAVKDEGVSAAKVATFPYLRPLLMALRFLPFQAPLSVHEFIHYWSSVTFDWHVSRVMPDCDLFVGHDTSALLSGRRARMRGIPYVCDTGSSHLGWRLDLLNEEYASLGMPRLRRPWTFDREHDEYATADHIVVASSFAKRTFVERGVSEEKISVVPYGVDLKKFQRVAEPDENTFDILFVGSFNVRKGAHYLLEAFRKLARKNARLVVAGTVPENIRKRYSRHFTDERISLLGHVPHADLKTLMSRSHVLVLPSLDDGFGMVLAEAMACGCPVISTVNTGAADLIADGVEGFIIGIRDVETLTGKLDLLARDRELHKQMSQNALRNASTLRGWASYGEMMVQEYQRLLNRLAVAQ